MKLIGSRAVQAEGEGGGFTVYHTLYRIQMIAIFQAESITF